MDPEQAFKEVLAEEQQKGSSAPVAEGRAKSARARAEAGSPHPKEPKWWPGAQPHLEGGAGGAPAEEEAAEEPAAAEPAAEEPAAEETTAAEPAAQEPAAEEPSAVPAAESAPEAQPAAAEPAPATQQPAPQPAETPAAAAPAAAASAGPVATTGVSHGTATGNRMRPEDGVASPAQLDGQQAMYERRRLIDEVIKTGVPAAAAPNRERSGSGALALVYLLVPLLVIGFLAVNSDNSGDNPTGPTEAVDEEAGSDAEGTNTIVAVGNAFETEELRAEAGGTVSGTLENQDAVDHNIAFYESEDDTTDPEAAFYTSDTAAGGESVDYELTAPEEPGEYPFLCDFHPTTMTGTLLVGEAAGGEGGGGGGEGGGGDGEGGGGGGG